MNIIPEIEARRAFRSLDSKPISPEVLERLAQAAHLAPSFANNQPWRFISVTDKATLAALHETMTPGNYWAKPAPALTAVVTNPHWDQKSDDGREFAFLGTGMAAYAYQLQAVREGLIAHPIAGFDTKKAQSILGIPEGAVATVLIVLGYPGSDQDLNDRHKELEHSPRKRKPLAEVYGINGWNEGLAVPDKW